MPFKCRRVLFTVLLVFCCSLPACSKAPTAPGFAYTGIWSGFWKDYHMTDLGVPLGSAISLNVGDDGIGFATGVLERTYSNGKLIDRLSMTFTVYPDGSISGTGQWSFQFPGMSTSGEGEVLGQLDTSTNTGSGALHADVNGILVHFPWKVEREK